MHFSPDKNHCLELEFQILQIAPVRYLIVFVRYESFMALSVSKHYILVSYYQFLTYQHRQYLEINDGIVE